jgi:predicted glutamine amidotransferase
MGLGVGWYGTDATPGTAVQRSNCHPLRHEHWLFQHNGAIRASSAGVKRDFASLGPY